MKKTKLRSSGKNLVLLFTLIAVVAFVPHSFAKGKKRGTRLLIQKQDGQIFKTELLAVKGSKLILMDTRLSSEITVNIQELKSIQIIKKSRILEGIGIGLLIGGTAGALFGSSGGNSFSGG